MSGMPCWGKDQEVAAGVDKGPAVPWQAPQRPRPAGGGRLAGSNIAQPAVGDERLDRVGLGPGRAGDEGQGDVVGRAAADF